ncbi:hypothetical protein [Burkholderia phage FLC6]|nr:hypothetical protein [Burkholderia phage FLC6]BDD79408.1 hypothetical protein [Burkholderia phage FLC8]
MSLFMNVNPGDQVVVIPDWAYRQLAKKGKIEDVLNFSLMRQWFTQEQLVALDAFSGDGLSIFWTNGTIPHVSDRRQKYTKSLGYLWFFPEEAGQSVNGTEADKYARNQISELADKKEYSLKLVNQYVLDHLKQEAANKVDLHQSYSVYSASSKLIVVALNQGILSPVIFNRKEELRLSILRSVVEKLQQYYDLNVVHKTNWFEWYLTELDLLK